MKLDVLSRICGFNITFKRGLLNVSMPLLKCFRGVIQLLRIAEGEGQRALCICVDKQHPLVLPASPMPRLAVVVVLPTPPLLIRHRDHFAIRHMVFPSSYEFSRLRRSRRLCNRAKYSVFSSKSTAINWVIFDFSWSNQLKSADLLVRKKQIQV